MGLEVISVANANLGGAGLRRCRWTQPIDNRASDHGQRQQDPDDPDSHAALSPAPDAHPGHRGSPEVGRILLLWLEPG